MLAGKGTPPYVSCGEHARSESLTRNKGRDDRNEISDKWKEKEDKDLIKIEKKQMVKLYNQKRDVRLQAA